jgi:hypothetical protein
MKRNRLCAWMATVAVLGGATLSAPAMAGDDQYSALRAIEAQALSIEEMEQIAGQINAVEIGHALTALAGRLPAGSVAQQKVLALANLYYTNAAIIDAVLKALRLYTPPK